MTKVNCMKIQCVSVQKCRRSEMWNKIAKRLWNVYVNVDRKRKKYECLRLKEEKKIANYLFFFIYIINGNSSVKEEKSQNEIK